MKERHNSKLKRLVLTILLLFLTSFTLPAANKNTCPAFGIGSINTISQTVSITKRPQQIYITFHYEITVMYIPTHHSSQCRRHGITHHGPQGHDYTYTGSNLLETYADTAGRIKKYTYGHALISQTDATGSSESVVTDYQNSVSASVSASGGALTLFAYDPFGKVRYQSNPDTTRTLGWLSRQFDEETGNNYLINRYYNADRGSFLSPDQYHYVQTTTPFTFNLYQYGYANPLVNVDPEGLYTFDGRTIGSSVWAKPNKTEQEYDQFYGFTLAEDRVVAIMGKEKFNSLTPGERAELVVHYAMKLKELNHGRFFTIVKENDKDPGTALTRLPFGETWFNSDKIISQFYNYQEDLKQAQMGTVPYYLDKSIRYAGPRLWKGLEQFSAMATRAENRKLPEPELQRKMNLFMRNKLHIAGAYVSFSSEDIVAIAGVKAGVTLHFYIDKKGNERIFPTFDTNIFLSKGQRISIIKKLKEYATTSSVYGGSEQIGVTQGLIFADPTEFTSGRLLEDSTYVALSAKRYGTIEANWSRGQYFKIGFAFPFEGIGQGVSGGRFYSERFSNLPQRLKDPEVQKEIIWLLTNLTEVH